MKVFVITPVSLMEDWRRTAKEATGLSAHDGKKKTKGNSKNESSSDDTDGHVSTFDMFIFSWSNIAGYKSIHVAHSFDYIVICDEAHNMQSMTSKRTEDALKLMLAKRCQGALLLSGTPMKNGRPSNLFPLLRAVKHPFGDNQRKYEFYFCNGQQRLINGRDVWDASGSSNLKELHAHTSSHIFRMTKDECMSDELYPKKREYLKVRAFFDPITCANSMLNVFCRFLFLHAKSSDITKR
jgi:SNF2 family DNA or RNA helicase